MGATRAAVGEAAALSQPRQRRAARAVADSPGKLTRQWVRSDPSRCTWRTAENRCDSGVRDPRGQHVVLRVAARSLAAVFARPHERPVRALWRTRTHSCSLHEVLPCHEEEKWGTSCPTRGRVRPALPQVQHVCRTGQGSRGQGHRTAPAPEFRRAESDGGMAIARPQLPRVWAAAEHQPAVRPAHAAALLGAAVSASAPERSTFSGSVKLTEPCGSYALDARMLRPRCGSSATSYVPRLCVLGASGSGAVASCSSNGSLTLV